MGLPLWLVGPLSFDLSDKRLKRAGLDYWPHLDLTVEENEIKAVERLTPDQPVLFSAHADTEVWDYDLTTTGAFIFGGETKGLSEYWHGLGWPAVRFPYSEHVRCYNLSNTVAAAAMEWSRQSGWRPGQVGEP